MDNTQKTITIMPAHIAAAKAWENDYRNPNSPLYDPERIANEQKLVTGDSENSDSEITLPNFNSNIPIEMYIWRIQ